MADRIKGITVQIGGDTTGLSNALKNVQKEIGYLNSDLKDINRLLKLDPTNTELLAQKQRALANNINFTEQKLKTLKIAQQQMNATFQQSGTITEEQQRQYDGLQREIFETETALKKLQAQASTTNQVLSQIGDVANKVANGAEQIYQKTQMLSTGAVVAIGAMGKAAIDFESAFAGVEKTVDGTDEEIANLREGIIEMSNEIPATAEEISAVAAAAGQLGIKTGDILSFTRTMIDLGESTNISAEEAASALAKMANITGTTAEDYSRLGATIVDLGNNFATTEADIVEMSTRLASAGTLAGLTEAEILALATAMSSVGIEAEAGGTAMTQTMNEIEKAVNSGGDNLLKMAEIAGMSSDDFVDAWKNEPIKAIENFIEGIGNLADEGESATEVLDELGMSGIRQSNMLRALGLASDTLSDAVGTANNAWEENVALTNEANKRYETTQSQLEITRNNIVNMAAEIGENLLPVIAKALEAVRDITKWFTNLNESQQNAVLGVLALVAAIAPLAKVVSVGASGVSTLCGWLIKLNTSLMATGLSLGAIIAPVAAVLAVVGGLVAAFKHLWDTNEGFRTRVTEIWNEIKASFEEFGAAIVERLNELGFNFQNITEVIKTAWDMLCAWMAPQFEITFAAIQLILSTALDVILGILDVFIAVFQGDWQGAWEAIKGIFTDVWENIKTFLGHSLDAIKAAAEEAWTKLNEVTDGKFGEIVTTITEAITGVITDALNWGREICDNIAAGINAGIGAVQNAINAVAGALRLPPVDFSGIMIGGGGSSHSGGSVYNTTVNNTFNNANRTSAMSAARTINRELGMMMN